MFKFEIEFKSFDDQIDAINVAISIGFIKGKCESIMQINSLWFSVTEWDKCIKNIKMNEDFIMKDFSEEFILNLSECILKIAYFDKIYNFEMSDNLKLNDEECLHVINKLVEYDSERWW